MVPTPYPLSNLQKFGSESNKKSTTHIDIFSLPSSNLMQHNPTVLKLVPTTLHGNALKWCVGLHESSIPIFQ